MKRRINKQTYNGNRQTNGETGMGVTPLPQFCGRGGFENNRDSQLAHQIFPVHNSGLNEHESNKWALKESSASTVVAPANT